MDLMKVLTKNIIVSLVLIMISSIAYASHINKITVNNNTRIASSTILHYLKLKVGDSYNTDKANDAIKSLYATELFEDIKLDFQNGHLFVKVDEPPLVTQIVLEGNNKLGSNTLTKDLITQVGFSLKKSAVIRDVERIKEIYKRSGRFSIIVESKVEYLQNNRAKVIFSIKEGPKTYIKNIYFVGNKYYKDNELKSVILTKESRWFRFLETNDVYDPDRIEYDKELLKEFYNSVGYADFSITSAITEISKTKDYFTVTYSIDEGRKYYINKISIDNKIQNIDINLVSKFINVSSGDMFNMNRLEKISDKIADYLAVLGYSQVNVYPVIDSKVEDKIDIKIIIDNAEKVYIDKINITGNLKTHDKVIRREVKIAEGDIFNSNYIQSSERNVRNLDYFDKLSFRLTPTQKIDKYNLDINLAEKSTASIGFDAGYNTSSGPFAAVSFIERNLIGTGKYLSAGVQVGRKNTNYNLGITEPYFLDRDLSLGTSVFKSYSGSGSGFASTEQNYDLKTLGMKVSLGYQIFDDLRHDIDYTIKQDKLSSDKTDSSRFIIEQMGKFNTSLIEHSFTYDKTDSRIIPKNGYIATFTQGYAGLGGDIKYLKHEMDVKFFQSFFDNKLTYKIAGCVGDIFGIGSNRSVRISDRFNLGDYTLRGFESGGLGPRDKNTKEGLGGQHFFSITNELNFPLGLPEEFNLTGVVFNDIGNVWKIQLPKKSTYTKADFYDEKYIRASVGFGFIWITRFAPIRMDFGFPIKKRKYDNKQNFHVKFSTHF